MKVSVIVPDNMVIVDEVARIVNLSDIEPGLHAVQWFGAEGHIEYVGANARNVKISEFTPLQFILDRWVAAAPVVTPPPPPLTKEEEFARAFSDGVLKAIIQEIVSRLGITERDFIDAVKARLQ